VHISAIPGRERNDRNQRAITCCQLFGSAEMLDLSPKCAANDVRQKQRGRRHVSGVIGRAAVPCRRFIPIKGQQPTQDHSGSPVCVLRLAIFTSGRLEPFRGEPISPLT